MRIRQVRPEYFTDPVTARLTVETRLLYIGLWCIADDAGWLRWDVAQLGALLMPYDLPKRREGHIAKAGEELLAAGRLVLRDCGCAVIPTLAKHQRITGKQSFSAREAHSKRCALTDKQSPLSVSPVTERNVTVSNGSARASAKDGEESEFRSKVSEAVALGIERVTA